MLIWLWLQVSHWFIQDYIYCTNAQCICHLSHLYATHPLTFGMCHCFWASLLTIYHSTGLYCVQLFCVSVWLFCLLHFFKCKLVHHTVKWCLFRPLHASLFQNIDYPLIRLTFDPCYAFWIVYDCLLKENTVSFIFLTVITIILRDMFVLYHYLSRLYVLS